MPMSKKQAARKGGKTASRSRMRTMGSKGGSSLHGRKTTTRSKTRASTRSRGRTTARSR